VVATSIGAEGLEDLVGAGLFISDSPAGLARRVRELLDDPAEAARQGSLGREAVQEHFSWDSSLDPLLAGIRTG
jgi:glycosyltransferase involved in cell wall biosynthesis